MEKFVKLLSVFALAATAFALVGDPALAALSRRRFLRWSAAAVVGGSALWGGARMVGGSAPGEAPGRRATGNIGTRLGCLARICRI